MIARRMINFPSMGWQNPFTEMERMVQQMDLLTKAMFGGRPAMRLYPSGSRLRARDKVMCSA